MEINITVQIDHESTLSVGRHFLTIPVFVMYEQRVANGAAKMFVGSVEWVTVNFTVIEGTKSVDMIFIISITVIYYYCLDVIYQTRKTAFDHISKHEKSEIWSNTDLGDQCFFVIETETKKKRRKKIVKIYAN